MSREVGYFVGKVRCSDLSYMLLNPKCAQFVIYNSHLATLWTNSYTYTVSPDPDPKYSHRYVRYRYLYSIPDPDSMNADQNQISVSGSKL